MRKNTFQNRHLRINTNLKGFSNMNIANNLESIEHDLSRDIHLKAHRPVNAGLFPHFNMSFCVTLSLFLFYSKVERNYLRGIRGKSVVDAYINERIKPEAVFRYRKKIKNMCSSYLETSQLSEVYNPTLENVLNCEELKELTAGYLTIYYEGVGKEIVDTLIDRVVELVKEL